MTSLNRIKAMNAVCGADLYTVWVDQAGRIDPLLSFPPWDAMRESHKGAWNHLAAVVMMGALDVGNRVKSATEGQGSLDPLQITLTLPDATKEIQMMAALDFVVAQLAKNEHEAKRAVNWLHFKYGSPP